jgi:hypothetical protein
MPVTEWGASTGCNSGRLWQAAPGQQAVTVIGCCLDIRQSRGSRYWYRYQYREVFTAGAGQLQVAPLIAKEAGTAFVVPFQVPLNPMPVKVAPAAMLPL